MIQKMILLVIGIAILMVGEAKAGPTYSAVGDFSNSSNPNGQWQYLTSNGTTSSILAQPYSVSANTRGWINSSITFPNAAFIGKNFGTTTDTYETIILPTNLLVMDGQGLNTIVRWTAPTAGVWSIAGLFQGVDVDEGAHNVEILKDSSTVLLGPTAINSYGAQANYNSTLSLNAGDTIDFVELTGNGGTFLSTGLSATITNLTSVPEPSSLVLMSIGGIAGLGYAWRRRRAQVAA